MLIGRVQERRNSQKWAAVLLDLLVVFVGIFAAFQVDRWNEERRFRSMEYDHLVALSQDFSANRLSLQETIKDNHETVDSALALLAYQTGDPVELDHDTFYNHMREVQSLANWEPRRNAYDVLVATGEMGLIRDDVLKSDLAAYFAEVGRLSERRSELIMQRTTSLQPFINANLDNVALVAKSHPEKFGTLPPSLPLDQFKSVIGTAEFEGVVTTKMHSSYDATNNYTRLLDLNNEIELRLAELLQIK